MKKLILASVSPRRKEILSMVGLTFRVAKSNIEEKFNPRLSSKSQAEELSKQKAEAVAKRFVDAVIIGVDQVISLESETIGKPNNDADAKRILSKLQGRGHSVITAFTIIDTQSGKTITESVETKVYIKKMSKKEIEWYVMTKEPMDKAGAYAIQGKGAMLITKIEGDYFNVVGLPISSLVDELKRFGFTFA